MKNKLKNFLFGLYSLLFYRWVAFFVFLLLIIFSVVFAVVPQPTPEEIAQKKAEFAAINLEGCIVYGYGDNSPSDEANYYKVKCKKD